MFLEASGDCKLRGKGAEIKSVAKVLKILWEGYMNKRLEVHRMLFTLLKLNCRMEYLMVESKELDAFPLESAQLFSQCCQQMGHLQCRRCAWPFHYYFKVTLPCARQCLGAFQV